MKGSMYHLALFGPNIKDKTIWTIIIAKIAKNVLDLLNFISKIATLPIPKVSVRDPKLFGKINQYGKQPL
tara:strand:+ start:467 stop:676 length:210 start_codon:yes stop_codon:yes gene_type:complete